MKDRSEIVLSQWTKRALILAILLTVFPIVALLTGQPPYFVRNFSLKTLFEILLILFPWTPVISMYLRLRATSCICASILCMGFLGTGAFALVAPDSYVKFIIAAIFLLVGIFYLLFSLKTWQLHQMFWLKEVSK